MEPLFKASFKDFQMEASNQIKASFKDFRLVRHKLTWDTCLYKCFTQNVEKN